MGEESERVGVGDDRVAVLSSEEVDVGAEMMELNGAKRV